MSETRHLQLATLAILLISSLFLALCWLYYSMLISVGWARHLAKRARTHAVECVLVHTVAVAVRVEEAWQHVPHLLQCGSCQCSLALYALGQHWQLQALWGMGRRAPRAAAARCSPMRPATRPICRQHDTAVHLDAKGWDRHWCGGDGVPGCRADV